MSRHIFSHEPNHLSFTLITSVQNRIKVEWLTLVLLLLVFVGCLVEVVVALGVVCLAGLEVFLWDDVFVVVVVFSFCWSACTLSSDDPVNKSVIGLRIATKIAVFYFICIKKKAYAGMIFNDKALTYQKVAKFCSKQRLFQEQRQCSMYSKHSGQNELLPC